MKMVNQQVAVVFISNGRKMAYQNFKNFAIKFWLERNLYTLKKNLTDWESNERERGILLVYNVELVTESTCIEQDI